MSSKVQGSLDNVTPIIVRTNFPLHKCAQKNQVDEVERLLAYGACNVNELDNFGQTALHVASFEGHKSVVEILLKKGGAVDIQDKNGWSCLHSAAQAGQLDICERLLLEGADPNIQVCATILTI